MAEDEANLRNAFFSQNDMHDSMSSAVTGVWALGYFPALYMISKKVQPAGCAFFTLAWGYSYYKGINPFMKGRLQAGLNAHAAKFVDKYNIKTDEDYMK